ncbi:MAG: lipoyl synthase [Nitrospira bacterium HGW-Nitrospira-1]|nr:MAG: lipoyl synthase [Nitrospira bacterium HGW-Nitrospira-1]
MRLPAWIQTGNRTNSHDTKHLLRRHKLRTVCEEARCPNMGECFRRPAAAFMILGASCTRNCGFCSVGSFMPDKIDENEPENVAEAAKEMKLKYIVVTSVTRDDLEDGGAGQFVKTIGAIRRRMPHTKIEVLTPDFQGDINSLKAVLDAGPDVFNHNVETVPRLYPVVRPDADYDRSLFVLKQSKKLSPDILTKSGFMLGLGETYDEVMSVLKDLRKVDCDFVTIGQYLRPTKKNLPVVKYILPEVFEDLGRKALDMGFKCAASGPLVRSSMNAEEMYEHV